MAASASTTVVMAALAGNACIAVAKLVAAAWTGSAAMLSEAIHSIADTANQGLLLLGLKRARRPPDERHPFGYGTEVYFWAFVVAILLFSLGAGVAIYEGVDKLLHPHPITDPVVNLVVLSIAFVFEAGSAWVAIGEFNRRRNGEEALDALRHSKDPALYTVLLEDLAALTGLLVAFAGTGAAYFLGWSEADAIASILIGLILGGVAAFMSIETKALLIGEAASPAVVGKIRRFIEAEMGSGPVVAINELRTMHLGPEDVLVAASLDFRDGETAKGVEAAVGRIDAAIKKRFPEVRYLFLDVQSGARAAPATLLGSTEPVASRPVEEATQARPLASLAQLAKGAPDVPRKTYPPSKRAKSKKRR